MTYALHPVQAQRLVLLVEHVRTCKHPSAQHGHTPDGDAWCVHCGAARLQGQWVAPAWIAALERQMQAWQLMQVEGN